MRLAGRIEWMAFGLGLLQAALLLWLSLAPTLAIADASDREREARRALALSERQPEIGEAALLGLLLQVQQLEPDLADQAWLELVSAYQPKIVRPHDHARQMVEAVYPVDVIARGQLNRLQREVRRLQGVRWLAYPVRFIRSYQAEERWPEGYLDALDQASAEQARELQALLTGRVLDARLADLLGELALRRSDGAALERALEQADPVRAGRWLSQLQAAKSTQYESAMQAAGRRAELASRVAALRMTEQPGVSSADREALIAQLADPRTGSAAILPLARSLDQAGLQDLRLRLEGSDDPLLRRRLLQVMSLAPSALSAEVAKLTSDPSFLLQLDQESRAWLVR